MGYLSEETIDEITESIDIIPLSKDVDINIYNFDSGIEEYNNFLVSAFSYDEINVSKTHLLIHKERNLLLGYITLSTDSIKLTQKEKDGSDLADVKFCSIPAIKIGKLAINKALPDDVKRKGFGSFLIEWARGVAFEVNENGVACKFLTVDADIEYNPDTTMFYVKNGFKENLANRNKNGQTVSMRLDIINEE